MNGGCGGWKSKHITNVTSLAEKHWTPSQMSRMQPESEVRNVPGVVDGPTRTDIRVLGATTKESGSLWYWCKLTWQMQQQQVFQEL